MKKQFGKKGISLILIIAMVMALIPAISISAKAEKFEESINYLTEPEAKKFLAIIRSCESGDILSTDPQLLILRGESEDKTEAGKLGKQIATFWTRFDSGEMHFLSPTIENYFNGDYDIISDLSGELKEKMYQDSLKSYTDLGAGINSL